MRPIRRPAHILATLVLAAAGLWHAAPAHADWVSVGQTPGLSLWWDRSSRVQDDYVWRVWEIQDMAAPDPEGVRSRQYVNEYDCKHRMHRIGRMSSYAGPMLTGRKLFEVDEFGYWRALPPGSLFERGFVLHCGPGTWKASDEKKAPWWAPFWPFGQ
jgi:hypothetical protein